MPGYTLAPEASGVGTIPAKPRGSRVGKVVPPKETRVPSPEGRTDIGQIKRPDVPWAQDVVMDTGLEWMQVGQRVPDAVEGWDPGDMMITSLDGERGPGSGLWGARRPRKLVCITRVWILALPLTKCYLTSLGLNFPLVKDGTGGIMDKYKNNVLSGRNQSQRPQNMWSTYMKCPE